MPIGTQSRNLPGRMMRGQHYVNGVRASTELSALTAGSQTTTSYRSRDRKQGADSEYNDLTGVQLYRSVRSEYQTRFDNGHEFSTEKTYSDSLQGSNYYVVPNGPKSSDRYVYIGDAVIVDLSDGSYPSLGAFPNLTERQADGRKAIGRTTPTTQEAGLALMLGELREKLPQFMGTSVMRNIHSGWNPVKGRKGSAQQTVGDEFLNVQFGLLPTKADIQALCQAILEFGKVSTQFQKDSDQVIRRRATIRDTKIVTNESSFGASVQLPRRNLVSVTSQFLGAAGGRKYTIFSDRCWFSGAYTYHVSEAHSFLGKVDMYAQIANRILGTELTPEVIWELTPWSWLIDWFTDVGTFMHNISVLHSDSLVLRYGYVMHEQRATCIRTVPLSTVNLGYGPSQIPPTVSSSMTRHKKVRTRSTPYGFGVNMGSLSPTRWAILGALGMTKSATTLRQGV